MPTERFVKLKGEKKAVYLPNKENLLKANGDFWPVMEAALHHQLKFCKTNQICRLLYLASESSSNSYEANFREYK